MASDNKTLLERDYNCGLNSLPSKFPLPQFTYFQKFIGTSLLSVKLPDYNVGKNIR